MVFQPLPDDDEIDVLVNERLDEISQTALEGIRFTIDEETGLTLVYHGQSEGLDRWFLVSAEGIKQHLNYCEKFWDHLDSECSVEGYLRSQGEDLRMLID